MYTEMAITTHICSLDLATTKKSQYISTYDEQFGQRFKRKFKGCTLISLSNSLWIDYFASELQVLEETSRHSKSKYFYIIHPFSKFRSFYELWLLVLFSVTIIFKPLDMAYNTKIDQRTFEFNVMSTVVNGLLFADIIMTFFTGYANEKKKVIVLHQLKIARRYVFCSFGFICDVLSCLPKQQIWYYIPVEAVLAINFLMLLNLYKFYYLITYYCRTEKTFGLGSSNPLFKSVLMVFFECLTLVHWMACLHYFVPYACEILYGITEPLWYELENIKNADIFTQYVHSFFRSSAMMLSVSALLHKIQTAEEVLLAVFAYLMGPLMTAFAFVALLNHMQCRQSVDIKFNQLMNQLEEYIKYKQLPPEMRKRIIQCYEYRYRRKYFKEGLITRTLSDNLKKEINIHICKRLIENVTLLSELSATKMIELLGYLVAEVYLPRDVIVQAGSHGSAMYFLASGTVAVYTSSGKEMCHMHDGAYFGEISMIFKTQKRIATVVAVEICEVYKLDKRNFDYCFLNDQNLYNQIVSTAHERLAFIQDTEIQYKQELLEKKMKTIG